MAEDGIARDTGLPERAGDRLRAARLAQGLDITEIAARTRIPQRHLEAIESGRYSLLPSTTYAVGFAKAYARAIGEDEPSIAADVRGEVAVNWDRPGPTPVYDEDPVRSPSRGLVWVGALAAVLIVLASAIYFSTGLFRRDEAPPAAAPAPAAVAAAPTPAAPPTPAGGQVTLTANDEVWVRVYDTKNDTLLIKTLAPGERYDVPPGADGPMINVGRPDKLTVTVNGSAVPPLGSGKVAIKDVPISAEALLARGAVGDGGAATGNSTAP
jgi:cytoskeleton protein RodZ